MGTQTEAGRGGSARPRLLDLFCCAGGAGTGYARAGFLVVGVDLNPQPNYPFTFYQGDALEIVRKVGHLFDAIHASPPCQAFSPATKYNPGRADEHPDLLEPTRAALMATGRPWVMENVTQAPLVNPTVLCGTMFGLRMYRHRGFESSFPLVAPPHPPHVARCSSNGVVPTEAKPFMSIHGGKHSRAWLAAAKEAMGMPWVGTIREVCEAIPPAYTQYIGEALLAHLATTERRKAA